MPPRSHEARPREITEACDDIARMLIGMDPKSFDDLPESDRLRFRAVKNALSEIGEAIKALPPDMCARR